MNLATHGLASEARVGVAGGLVGLHALHEVILGGLELGAVGASLFGGHIGNVPDSRQATDGGVVVVILKFELNVIQVLEDDIATAHRLGCHGHGGWGWGG